LDQPWWRPDPVTITILVVCIVIELMLQLSDHGIIDLPRLRSLTYTYGGFWPGLLVDWTPNFPGQSITMFFTYGFLHGGLVHLVVNMITLLSLGAAVCIRGGAKRYVLIYVASILGGAAVFGLLAPSLRPMVGASGALFGLVGALTAWDAMERRALRLSMRPVIRVIGILVLLNVVLWWAMDGLLAWQTHLGGFLAGAAMAAYLGEREPAGQ
jgi:membrane associated rhomboid family serine protease